MKQLSDFQSMNILNLEQTFTITSPVEENILKAVHISKLPIVFSSQKSSKFKVTMHTGRLPEKLKPLCWIMGEWRSLKAVINYPTMKCPINCYEKLSFVSIGQPTLNYRSFIWNSVDGTLIQQETGFLEVQDDGTSVALIMARNCGIATIEEGFTKDCTLVTNSSCIGHTKCVEQKVVTLQRCYKLNEKGQLEFCAMMETPQTPLTQYISACYEKCT